MQQMVALRKELDPYGGRVMGARDGALDNQSLSSVQEYFGVMMPQDRRLDTQTSPTAIFRGYSLQRRDRAPVVEAEDFREEAARRFWDNYSPPFFGFKKGPDDTWNLNSETFCLQAAARYHDYFINNISNTDPAHSRWSGYCSIYWTDENADGRQDSSEVCRVSGKVDAVRLPKELYFVSRVMQSDTPDIHIIGHWTYPANTVKTMYVAANHCDSVELFVNGKSLGVSKTPENGYIFAFPQVRFEAGKISAVAKAGGKIVAQDAIETAGAATAIKLTPHVGPNGLQADGSDVVFYDVEVVDAKGERCPTDEARVDFKVTGPAIWRGGYDSGKPGSVNKLYLDTECGINRVAIRSTLTPGTITLTATRAGLAPATVQVESQPVDIKDGLAAR
jgi:beta-galactosidase